MTSQSILCLWAALEFSFLMFRIGWGFLRGHFQVNSLLSEWLQPVGLLFFQFPCWKWFYRHKLLTSTVLGSSTIVFIFCWLIHVLPWWWWLYKSRVILPLETTDWTRYCNPCHLGIVSPQCKFWWSKLHGYILQQAF